MSEATIAPPSQPPAGDEGGRSKTRKKLDELKRKRRTSEATPLDVLKSPKKAENRRLKTVVDGFVRNEVISPDAAMQAVFEKVSELSDNRKILSSREAETAICGIPLPALSARYLFQQTVMPLSRQIMIYGDWGSAKSALLAEFYRWFMLNSALAAHVDNENKDGPDLRNSIFYLNPSFIDRLMVESSDSQEEWMGVILRWVEAYEAKLAKLSPKAIKPPKRKESETAAEYRARTARKVLANPGYIYPMIIGLDSVTATASLNTIQDIHDDGATKRRFQVEAMGLSDLAKALPSLFRDKPAILVMVNHRKDKVDGKTGFVSDRIPGGNAMRFMNTTEIRLEKVSKIETTDFGGIRVRMSIPKNSLGPTGSSIEVDLKWWYELDPDTGDYVQKTAWDWHAATIDLLLNYVKKYAARRNLIDEVVDLHQTTGHRVWSKKLNIPSSKPVSYSTAGAMIEANRELVEQLHNVMHIKKRTEFVPGVEYGEIQAHLLAAAQERENVYARQAVDLSGVAFLDEELDRAAKQEKAKRKTGTQVLVAGDEDDDA